MRRFLLHRLIASRHIFSLLLTTICLLNACALAAQSADLKQAPSAPQTLRIAAAADLQPVLPALLASFKAQNPAALIVSYGSSATLATQIEQGAPFDLYLAADLSFPQKLVQAGLVPDHTVHPYARGTLVLWTRKDSKLPPLTVALLKTDVVPSVAVANPEHAPYGRAAMASLTSLGMLPAIQSKLRTAENIAQTAQFAESGNATVGLLSLTSAVTPKLQAEGHYIAMPANSYPPIQQGAVVLKQAHAPGLAAAFLRFLLSPATQQSLSRYGLSPAQ